MVKCRGVQSNGSRSHTPGGVGRKGRHHMYSGGWGRQARTQVNRCRHSSRTASYVRNMQVGLRV